MASSHLISAHVGSAAFGRYVRFGLLFLIAALPVLFALLIWDPALTDARARAARSYGTPVLLVELAVVILAVADGWTIRRTLSRLGRSQRTLLGLLIATAIGTATWIAPDSGAATARTGATIVHVVFGFATAHVLARWDESARDMLWPAAAIGLIGFFALIPLYLAAIADPVTFDWNHFGLGGTHIRHVGYHAAIGGSLALGLAAIQRERSRWLCWIAMASVGVAVAAWSGSRGALVAIIVGSVAAAFALPTMRTARAWAGLVLALVLGVLSVLPLTPPAPAFGLWRMSMVMGSDDISTGRIEIWRGTVRAIAARPLFGHGEGQFRSLVTEADVFFNHPHNLLLQIGFQWGLAGLACVTLLGLSVGRDAWRAARLMPESATPAATLICTLLVFAAYDGVGFYAYPVMIFTLALAFLLTLPGRSRA